jgi:competence protein ComEC
MARLSHHTPVMGDRCAVPAALAVWLGLLLGARFCAGVTTGCAALAVALMLLALSGRSPARVATVSVIAALGFAALAAGGGRALALERSRGVVERDGAYWVDARIVEPPLRESGEPIAIGVIEAARPALPRGARVRIRLPQGCAAEWGDRCRAFARLDAPRGPRNPGGFDARSTADAAGLIATGVARFAEVSPGRGIHAWPRASVMRWRRAFEGEAHAGLTDAARTLALPLVLGDRSALPLELDAAFRASGLVHLLALSGLHVAWLAAVARGLVATLGAGVPGRAIARLMCATLYVGIAGPLPSLMRAAATEALGAAAKLTGRALDPIQALAVSALALLVWRPGWAGDLGFQLSCAATLGLVAIAPSLAPRHAGWRGPFAQFAPTLGAQLMATPLLLARMHAVSWIAPFANLLAVPLSGLLLAAAWLGLIVEAALPGTGTLPFAACDALAIALERAVSAAARAPSALLSAGDSPVTVACAALGAALLAWSLARAGSRLARQEAPSSARAACRWLGAALFGISLTLVATESAFRPPPGHTWLVALDVGQGDALAIGSPDGWRLVDAGGRSPRFDAGQGVLLPFLHWVGVRRVRFLALTHDDGDHTGGAAALLHGMPVDRVLAAPPFSGAPGPGARYGAARIARGDTLSGTPWIRVLWPPRQGAGQWLEHPLTSADNAVALVFEVGEGQGRALLTADVDSMVEESLAFRAPVALLKVGHHGSASSSGARFLARAGPEMAVISVGARNRFGHPAPAVLERLSRTSSAVLRTDLEGALWFDLSAGGVKRLEWQRGRSALRDGEPSLATRSTAAPRAP